MTKPWERERDPVVVSEDAVQVVTEDWEFWKSEPQLGSWKIVKERPEN